MDSYPWQEESNASLPRPRRTLNQQRPVPRLVDRTSVRGASASGPDPSGSDRNDPDLKELDYRDPELNCDVILKGGITSGIVYPEAICELARTYRFRNVGGASAGAIAAAATAAAELGRESDGFNKLAEVPADLAEDGRLISMFAPSAETRRLHSALIGSMVARHIHSRILTGLSKYWPFFLAGAIPSLIPFAASFATSGWPAVVLAIVALVLALVGGCLFAAFGVMRDVAELPKAGFGLASGFSHEGDREGPLTNWLHALLNDLADLDPSRPLTFGNLWGNEDTEGEPSPQRIDLEMMVTNLGNRTAVRLPADTRTWFFDPVQFRGLFPEEIVSWMEAHPSPLTKTPASTRDSLLTRKLMLPLRPFPEARDLPVVVATRMSLAFPLLVSAVPIYRIDWGLKRNQKARQDWRDWLKERPAEWDPTGSDISDWPGPIPSGSPVAEPCWISDGGISSNLPIHFFDRPLPRWPTFAMNLSPFHPDYPKQSDEDANSWMPDTYKSGILQGFYPLTSGGGFKELFDFGESIVRTMQNRNFEALMRMPGYRDRVVHVRLAPNEGGINLGMTSEQIMPLATRGRGAAKRLVRTFTRPSRGKEISWDAHRWTRLRSILVALEQLNKTTAAGLDAEVEPSDAPKYVDLLARGKNPPDSYRIDAELTDLAELELSAIRDSAQRIHDSGRSFAEDEPEPGGELRIVPSDE